MGKLGFYFNMNNCIGCHTCQIACKDKNDLPVGVNFRKVSTFETGAYPTARLYHFSGACNHCENPACVAACPTGAMYICEDGTVQHDDEICIGCQACVKACPYGQPALIESLGIVHKCDSCKALRDAGQNPVCVDSCLHRAIEFGDLDELRAKHAGEGLVSELPCMPESITNPSVVINPREYAGEDEFYSVTL